jgi:acetoacetyl-CoA synthetase
MAGANGTHVSNGIATKAPKLWEHPSPESTKMYEFIQMLNKKKSLQLTTYDDLHAWSISNIAAFWEEIWEFTGIKASETYQKVSIIQIRSSEPLLIIYKGCSRRKGINVSTPKLV